MGNKNKYGEDTYVLLSFGAVNQNKVEATATAINTPTTV